MTKEGMRGWLRGSQHLALGCSLGSARVPRAGFGVAPKRSFSMLRSPGEREHSKVRDREDAITHMRDACATHILGCTRKLSGPIG